MPPRADVLNDAMPALFDLLEQEANHRFEPFSGIGYSATFIPIRTATDAWRAF